MKKQHTSKSRISFLLLLTILISSVVAQAQPVITTFAPASGGIGSSVTITGTGFNITAAQNIVFFGATKATVTAATATSLTVTVPLGATYQYLSVTNLAVNLTAYSTKPFIVNFAGSTSFVPKVDFSTGTQPYSVSIGDIDGDGKSDLVVANNGSNTVSVLRNTSTSGSTSFAAKVDFATGTNPRSVSIGDITGDGKPDLAVSNQNSNNVSVLRNTSTSGAVSFAAKVDFGTGINPYSVSIGDIDGNGKPDLVVANMGSNNVSILLNSSTLGTVSFPTKTDIVTGTSPWSVSIGDIDGDGKPDLALANNGSNTVSVFRNTSPLGGVSFAAKVDFASGISPYSVSIGDIDGDGKSDLAVANDGSNTVSVLRNTSTSGTVSFAAKVDFVTSASPYSVSIGDLDGDGKTDLVVANNDSNTVCVLRNTSTSGSVSFVTKVDFATGTNPASVSIGDVDGDGKPDLVVANAGSSTVSVIRQIGTTKIISFAPATGAIGSTIIITGKAFSTSAAQNIVFFGATKATVTAATDTSLTVIVPLGATYQYLSVTNLLNNQTAYSAKPFIVTLDGSTTFVPKVDFATGPSPCSVSIGDIDGDGKPDLIMVNSGSYTVSVLRNTSTSGTTSFAPKVDFAVLGPATNTQSVCIGDIDGDGKPDLAVNHTYGLSILRNTSSSGTVSFAPEIFYSIGTGPRSLSMGDIDGDSKPDLVVPVFYSWCVAVFRNTSTPGSVSFAASVCFTTGITPISVSIGDIDGDGKPDLAVTNNGGSSVSVLRNTSTPGIVNFATKVDFATGTDPILVSIGDIDGDSKPDLAVANDGSNTVSLLRNTSTTGTVSFAPKVDFATGTNPRSVSIGDIDGNGKPDLAVANAGSSTVSVFRNTSTSGTVSFANKADFAAGSGSCSVSIGDIDGDGKPDLAVANAGSNTVSVLRQYPPTITSFTPATGAIGSIVTIAGIGFSTTSAQNIVFFGATRANVTAATANSLIVIVPFGATYQNLSVTNLEFNKTAYSAKPFVVTLAGSTNFIPKIDFTTGTNPYSVSIGDIDGDGKPDLVVANNGSNTVSVLRNTSTSGTTSFATKVDFAAGTNPISVRIGDIDGNGKPDLAVANYGSNTISVLLNTSTSGTVSFATKVDFTTGINPRSVSIGDIDGNGKPDLVVANFSGNSVSLLRNTSTSATVSFAAKVDYATGTNPYSVSLEDIDGDGKPDLAVANSGSNTVSVLPNTSTFGTFSFATKVDFATGTNPLSVSIGDIDGDGKPDLVVANNASNTVSLLRNTSISGTVSFAGNVDFATGTNPWSVSLGDIDGDGKPDLAVANNGSSTVSVMRNTSTTGTVSFATKVDFATGLAPNSISIGDIDGDGRPDLAVSNYSSATATVIRQTGSSFNILSFAPATGAIGSNVTISGSGFNTTAAQNIVFFGATKATVTAATATSLTVTVPLGATYQLLSVTNLAVNLTAFSAKPFIVTLAGSIAFAPKTDFTTGTNPWSVSTGDIDGDGKPDLALANTASSNVSVLRNTSTSGTTSFATKVDFATGTTPRAVSIGDLDGDGKPDLAVANDGSNTVSILRNTSTSGTVSFAAKVDFTTGTNPYSVSLGDIDGDGKPDLVVVNNSSNTISVFRNTSTLGTVSFASKLDFVTGTTPISVSIGDLDGDGKPDLAVANQSGNSVSVLRNASVVGTVSFATGVDFATGTNPISVSIGDIDSDGKPDLAVANASSNTVSVLLNTSIWGTVSFATKVDFATGASPYSVSIGDIDGDGKPDIAVANSGSSTVTVLRNTSTSGTASFATKADFETGSNPVSISICDIDGDGRPDLATANNFSNSVSVIRQPGFPKILSFAPAIGTIGSNVIITGKDFNTTAAQNIVFFGATQATVTAATVTSLTVTVPLGATYQYLSVTNLAVNLTAYSAKPFIVTLAGSTTFIPKADFTTGTTPWSVSIGDIDSDGKPDLAVANASSNTVSVLRNASTSGTTSFATKVDFPTGANPWSVSIGDIDGDGKPDLVVANQASNTVSVLRNTSTSGTVSFATMVDFATGASPRSVGIGDIDGDGKPDLAVGNVAGNNLSVLRNTSTSGTISFATKVDFATGINPFSVNIGDIDGDGKPDLAMANNFTASVSVLRNTSTPGTVSFAANVGFATGTNPISVSIGDLDGDGKPDLAVVNSGSNTMSILRNTSISGTVSFATKVDFATGTNPQSVSIGDIDGDGKPDMAVANYGSNTLSLLRNTSTSGTVSFATKIDFTTGTNPASINVGDIDGDGRPDMAVANAGSNTVSVIMQAGSPINILSFAPATGAIGSSVTITGAGFNTTAAQNIVFFGATKATVTAATASSLSVTVPLGATYQFLSVTNLANNQTAYSAKPFIVIILGSTAFAPKVDFTTGTTPYSVSIGDIDGDGKPDLAVANSVSNTVSVLRNTSTSGTTNFATNVDFVTGTNPRSVSIGDIDGDGKPDLAVANDGSNTVSILLNTSTSGTVSFAAKVDFVTGANPYFVSIAGDLDGNGKPDLAVANFGSNTVSILLNSSTLGTLNFPTTADFATGTAPRSVSTGDIDGDGKPDLAVANQSGNSLSVFRNTSLPGGVSFAAKVDFTTGTNPSSVSMGDIDGDGKPDLAVANNSSASVSVLRNISTSGTVSFAAKVDFTTGTNPASVSIGDIDGDGKPDLGVANNNSSTVSVLRNTSTSGTVSFAAKVDNATGTNPASVSIGDIDGDGWPDLAVANTGSNTVSVIRQLIRVTITTFSPSSGPIGSSVNITGTGFNPTAAQNIVFFGATQAVVTAATATSLTVTVPLGATYHYLSVTNLAANLTAYTAKPFIVTLAGSTAFVSKVDFATGTQPWSVNIGDIDGDGKPDLAVANYTSNTVSVLRNTSISGTTSFATKVDFTTGTNPYSVSIGDIDGDGKPDLAVTNYGSNTVSIFRNTSTLGTVSFAAKVDFVTGTQPVSVSIGDLDADGKSELVVGNFGSNTLSVLRNTSTSGTLSFAVKVDFTTGIQPRSVSTGDIDGDGKPDLAVTNIGSATLSVFRNTSTLGTVSFATKIDFTTGTNPISVNIGDLDGDGKSDLALANYISSSVSVLRNTSTPGTVSFAAKVDLATGVNPVSVSMGDIDGDGKPDLAAANSNSSTVSVWRNISTSGTVSFATKIDFATGSNPASVSIGDLDGDGKPDLAVANAGSNTVSVIMQAGSPVNIFSFAPATGAIGSSITITGTGFNTTLAQNIVFFGATQATVTAGTATSLTVAVPIGATYQYLSVTNLAVNLTAYSAKPFIVTLVGGTTFEPKVDFTTGTTPWSVSIGDIDGDGKPDLAVTNAGTSNISVLRNTSSSGTTSFATKVDFTTGTNPRSVSIGDIDGDGKPDLAVANDGSNTVSVLRNTSTSGTISFGTKVDYPTGTNPYSVSIGDIDGDGKPDLAVANNGSNTVSILRNTSTSGFVSFAAKVDFATGTQPRSVNIGDIDGDGKQDLAVANIGSNNLSVLRNTSTSAAMNFATKVDFATGNNPASVGIGDIDGDGKPDLAVANSGSNNVSILRNNSTLGSVSFSKFDFTTGTTPSSVSIGDIDGDGKPDMAVANGGNNTVSVLRNTSTSGTTSFATKVDFTTGTNPVSLSIGDIDGDGRPDMAVTNNSSNTVSVIRQTIPLTITSFAPGTGAIGSSVTIMGNGFNTNAAQNIVFFGATKATVTAATATSLTVTVPLGATYQYLSVTNLAVKLTAYSLKPFNVILAGSNNFVPKVDFTTGTNPWSVSIGDIDGEGKPDLVVANINSNSVSVFRNTSTAGGVSFAAKVDFASGINPYSVSVGDIDGDGKPDLAVGNVGSNTVSVLLNTSTSGTVSFAAKVDFVTSTNPRSVSIGDIDADGKPDLAVANDGSNTVSVLRNTSSLGTTNFATKVDFATGANPYSVSIGDIDGDGKPDLAVANYGSSNVSVLRNTSIWGTVSFVTKVDFTTGTNPASVSIGDIDGDGKSDLAVANSNSSNVSLLRNTSALGTASFAAKVDFATGASPYSVSIGDIDGDGKPDMAVANNISNTLSVIMQLTPVAITNFSPSSGAIGSIVNITGTGFNPTAAQNIVFFGATQAVVTAATATSLTVTVPLGANYEYLSVTNLAVNLTAYSTKPFIVTLAGSTSFLPKIDFTTGSTPWTVSISDIDGDSKPDLAVANYSSNTVSVLRNTSTAGTTSFATRVDFATGGTPYSVSIGDIDGDGKPDLAVANSNSGTVSVLRNTSTSGTVSFATKVDFATGPVPTFLCIGDIDGDGKPDLATSNWNNATVSALRNTSTSGAVSFATKADFAVGSGPQSLSIGDIDGDGKPDLAVPNGSSNTISVLRNTSTLGTTSFATKVDLTTGSGPYSVRIGDIDGDGKPDLAVPNSGSATVSVFRSTSTSGTVSFATKVDFTIGLSPYFVGIGDIDGDGKPDLAVANNGSNTVSVLKSTSASGTVSFAASVDFATGTNPGAVSIGDLDGDGKPDLAVANKGSNTVSVMRQVGLICIAPTVPTLSASSTTNCGSVSTSLSIASGSLNSATSWYWYSGSCGGTPVGTGTSVIVSPAATTTYFARGEGGCVTPGSCSSITITVNPTPAPLITAGGPTTFCSGGSVTLSAPAAGIINQRYASTVINFSSQYTPTDWSANQTLGAPNVYPSYGSNPLAWSPNGDPREFITLGFTNPSPINYIDIYETYKPGAIDTVYVKNPATGLFEVVYSVSAAPAYDSARVLHISFPMTTFNVSEIRIAINDAAIGSWNEIDAVAIGMEAPFSFLWSTGATTQTISVNTGGAFTVTVTNANGCTGTASIQVTRKAKPTVAVTPSAAVVCPPNVSVSLTAGGTASTYAWSPATGLNLTAGASVTASPAATTTYIVTGTSTAGCTATKTATVTVKPKPVNLSTSNITASSAITKWDTVACAVGYKLQYRKQGVTTWTTSNINSNSPTKNLSGLLAASSYQWRVKSKFADGTFSVNSATATFTTLVLRSGMETIESTNELVVYPNPATDKLNLEFPFTEGDATITVVNALGQTLLVQKVKTTDEVIELNIQSLTEGLYFVTVKNGDNTFNSRFVKK